MNLTIKVSIEGDGRKVAEVAELPGVIAYGGTRGAAVINAKALALRVLAERLEHGELNDSLDDVLFATV